MPPIEQLYQAAARTGSFAHIRLAARFLKAIRSIAGDNSDLYAGLIFALVCFAKRTGVTEEMLAASVAVAWDSTDIAAQGAEGAEG